jgi:hypothetical protein
MSYIDIVLTAHAPFSNCCVSQIQHKVFQTLIYVLLMSTEGSLLQHAASWTLLILCATTSLNPYDDIGDICSRTHAFTRECLEVIAAQSLDVTRTNEHHAFHSYVKTLLGDTLHRKKIWTYLHRHGWPLYNPPTENDSDRQAACNDIELSSIEAQVQAAIADIADEVREAFLWLSFCASCIDDMCGRTNYVFPPHGCLCSQCLQTK